MAYLVKHDFVKEVSCEMCSVLINFYVNKCLYRKIRKSIETNITFYEYCISDINTKVI